MKTIQALRAAEAYLLSLRAQFSTEAAWYSLEPAAAKTLAIVAAALVGLPDATAEPIAPQAYPQGRWSQMPELKPTETKLREIPKCPECGKPDPAGRCECLSDKLEENVRMQRERQKRLSGCEKP